MTPLPKRKLSKSRSAKRRSHQALKIPNLHECPNCHSYKKPHHACLACGVYKNKTVLVPKAKKDTA